MKHLFIVVMVVIGFFGTSYIYADTEDAILSKGDKVKAIKMALKSSYMPHLPGQVEIYIDAEGVIFNYKPNKCPLNKFGEIILEKCTKEVFQVKKNLSLIFEDYNDSNDTHLYGIQGIDKFKLAIKKNPMGPIFGQNRSTMDVTLIVLEGDKVVGAYPMFASYK